MVELHFKKASSTIKPKLIDETISENYVYIHKDINYENGRYYYKEACLNKLSYEMYKLKQLISNLDDDIQDDLNELVEYMDKNDIER